MFLKNANPLLKTRVYVEGAQKNTLGVNCSNDRTCDSRRGEAEY